MDNNSIGDFPLRATHRSIFLDPETKVQKPLMGGSKEDHLGVLDVECGSFGHFWYNMQECRSKIQRWDQAASRYDGNAFRRPRELFLLNGLNLYRASTDFNIWDSSELPAQFRELLPKLFESGMLGGTSHGSGIRERLTRIERKLWGILRKMSTIRARRRGLQGIKDSVVWKSLDSGNPTPTDISDVVIQQNKASG
jgi:hypothetical protein